MTTPGRTGPNPRTQVRRKAERGVYDRERIEAILDEALICHLGFGTPEGPCVLPTIHARVGSDLYLHGATGNHALRTLASGGPACVTATIVDGLVMAKSWFHHSMNYRSVVVFGTATRVDDREEKLGALRAVVEHVARGRADDARPPTEDELRATLVLRLPLTEASAKVRSGGPLDDPSDMAYPVWAGVVPLVLEAGAPVAGEHTATRPDAVPPYLKGYRRG